MEKRSLAGIVDIFDGIRKESITGFLDEAARLGLVLEQEGYSWRELKSYLDELRKVQVAEAKNRQRFAQIMRQCPSCGSMFMKLRPYIDEDVDHCYWFCKCQYSEYIEKPLS